MNFVNYSTISACMYKKQTLLEMALQVTPVPEVQSGNRKFINIQLGMSLKALYENYSFHNATLVNIFANAKNLEFHNYSVSQFLRIITNFRLINLKD